MSRLSILSPDLAAPVKAGQSGEIHVHFTPTNVFVIAGIASASITDASGKEVWRAEAPVLSNEAWLPVQWPATPGTYQVSATAYGAVMANVLADATHQFTVVA